LEIETSYMKLTTLFTIKLLFIALISIFILPSIFNITGLSQKFLLPGKEVYFVIQKSNRSLSSDVLILGDSVAHQLYQPEKHNEHYESLACNQAISLIGHYVLLENYLKNNTNTKKLYLIYHPSNFENRLDQIYTFNYFLKPFYKSCNYKLFTASTIDMISKIHFIKFLDIPIVRYTNVPLVFEGTQNWGGSTQKRYILSDISLEYLKKIKALTTKHNIKLRVISPFLAKKFNAYSSEDFTETLNNNGLNDIFEDYFKFSYLDSSNFIDNMHYSDPDKLGENPLHLTW
jgi:hypothetical protein